MGLFSNNKKPCPVCGKPTPRLLATKIEGMPICSECDGKIDMRQEKRDSLTIDTFKEYLRFYDENLPLKQEFQEDYVKNTGFFNTAAFKCDYTHHTFKLGILDNAIVYTSDNFVSLTISQDNTPVIELTKEELRIHDTDVPEYIESLRNSINAYNSLQEMREALMHVDAHQRMEHHRENPPQDNISPFEATMPFEKWHVTIEVKHPWDGGISDKSDQYWLDSYHPSINEAYDNYYNALAEYKEMAMVFRNTCCPDCKIVDEAERNSF